MSANTSPVAVVYRDGNCSAASVGIVCDAVSSVLAYVDFEDIVELDAVTQFMTLPLPALRNSWIVLSEREDTWDRPLSKILLSHRIMTDLTLDIMLASLRDLFDALQDLYFLIRLRVHIQILAGYDKESTSCLQSPRFRLRLFETNEFFSGCGVLIGNSSDSLQKLTLDYTRYFTYPDNAQPLLKGNAPLRDLRHLERRGTLPAAFPEVVSTCSVLHRLTIMTISSDTSMLGRVLSGVPAPIQHLGLAGHLTAHHLNALASALERRGSPLSTLRTIKFPVQAPRQLDALKEHMRRSRLADFLHSKRMALVFPSDKA